MKQKEKIISLLSDNGIMTQSELAEAIYGDKLHAPAVYTALMSLVNSNIVIQSGTRPARYSLSETSVPSRKEVVNAIIKKTDVPLIDAKQQTVTIPIERAVNNIRDYFSETVKDTHARYMSWVHCYKVFLENRNKTDEQTIDYLALHLAFYLASWGMYRSSFLLHKDYKIHIPVVRIIQEEKYNSLYAISAENLCKESNLILLDELGTRIKDCYAMEKPVLDRTPNKATDTLITKILLGTLGCVPAYDRYYKQAVKKYNISSDIYDRASVFDIAKYYCDNFDEFEELRQEISTCGIEYPPMKLMDMCFWQDSYIEDMRRRQN